MKYIMALILTLLASTSMAHEMTPTYPKLEQSWMSGILFTSLEIFNKRKDVEYYEVGVFDKDFNPVPFVSSFNIIKLPYLGHVKFEVFVSERHAKRAVYVCTRSRLWKEDKTATPVASKICSKFR